MSDLNLFQVFKNSAKKYEDKTALIYRSNHISYNRLLEAIERLANSLSKLGISPGDRMAVMLPNIPQFIISYIALLKLGAWVIPVNIMFKEGEIRYLLEDSEAKGIIALDRFSNQVQKAVQNLEFCNNIIYLGNHISNGSHNLTQLIASSNPMLEDIEIPFDSTAVVLYTAGTTGQPKGAELSHRNIMAQVDSIRQVLVLESKDTLSCVLPLFHSFGQTAAMHAPLVSGSTIVVLAKFIAEEVIKSFCRDGITIFFGLPTMFHALNQLEVNKEDFPQLKYCISSGAALSDKLRSSFEEKFGKPILEGYGLTEAGPLVAIQRLDHPRKTNSVGFPIDGVQVRIVDSTNNEVPNNEIGEIMVYGQNVMKGYLNRPKTSKEVLKDGWLNTGDLGKFDEDGYLYIIDRKKDLILKGGFNVYPREVESVLSAHPKIKDCVVIGVEDEIQGEEVKALVVFREGETLTNEELANYCRDRLAIYKCPKYIEYVKYLPRDSTGKILKSKILNTKLSDP
ncbi:MAG: long-chain fatty acid--CoA ligase [bacterium]